jgi:hypothetical protein
MEHPLSSPDLALSELWLFLKKNYALKERIFQDVEDIQKKCDDSTKSCSTAGVPKMFPQVAALSG